ncbi:uncharacterized protein LOC143193117 [Rhynchophorus ferrugineus]|uniref:uncharacterized protein LOC143193117 n=1 Tax=Rhynchophorus ferrugineus TaxID=354439 RepID=UPI003FCE01B8
MTDNNCQEVETTREEDIEKLLELSAQNNNDYDCYMKYFHHAIKGDTEYSYLAWLKDERFSPHVKLAIYKQQFTSGLYYIAQTRLDQAQTDQDMNDYLCHHLNDTSYVPYRDMLNNFLELMGKVMCFDYPIKTCQKIVHIAQNPEKYNKYQVCCALDVLCYSYYRFEITWSNGGQFYKDMAEKWKKIILETDDPDICTEALYYVLKKGNLESAEYSDLVEKLWDKHPHDGVSIALYRQYLKPRVMSLAFDRLKLLSECDTDQNKEILRYFSNVVSSSEFLHSVDFDLSHEMIQYCISNKETLKYFVEGMDEHYYNEGYFKIIDIVMNIYLNLESCSELKIICLSIMIKIVRNHSYSKQKNAFNAYLDMLNSYIEKITDNCISNSQNDIKQLRSAQALSLLFSDLRIHDSVRKKLRNSIVLILTKAEVSGGHSAFRQILLYAYLATLKTPIKYQELEELLKNVKDIPELYESYLLTLYHVLSNIKCSEDELNYLFSVVVQRENDDNIRIKVLTKMLYDKLADFCKRKHFKNVELLQSELDVVSNESELGSDTVFLKSLNPFPGVSSEIVLRLIPKLNQVDGDEWKSNNNDNYYFIGSNSKFKSVVDNFSKSVDEFLSDKYCK